MGQALARAEMDMGAVEALPEATLDDTRAVRAYIATRAEGHSTETAKSDFRVVARAQVERTRFMVVYPPLGRMLAQIHQASSQVTPLREFFTGSFTG